MKKIKRKKKVDLQIEGEGKPVCPSKEMPKPTNLTEEIRYFLNHPITFESIKYILLRFEGRLNEKEFEKAEMIIVGLIQNKHGKFFKFLIVLKHRYVSAHTYYITYGESYSLESYKSEKVTSSELKKFLFQKIYNWCENNPEKIQKI